MRLGSVLLTLTGFAIAGGSVFAARDYFETRATEAPAGAARTVDVLVASRDIAFGAVIEPQSVSTIAWPADAVPIGVYTDPDLLLADEGQEPRRARRAISQGELMLASRVSDFGEKVTITQSLTPGSRAMAISVDAETAVGGFVTPGDYVDVVLTQGSSETMRAVTILQDIRVLGVDQDANEQNDAPEVARTVTVEVTPDEGQRLALAQRAGTLSLTLRDLSGEATAPLDPIQLGDLLNLPAEPEPAPEPVVAAAPVEAAPEPAPVVRSVTVRRATTVSVETH